MPSASDLTSNSSGNSMSTILELGELSYHLLLTSWESYCLTFNLKISPRQNVRTRHVFGHPMRTEVCDACPACPVSRCAKTTSACRFDGKVSKTFAWTSIVCHLDEQFLDGSDLRCEQHVQCGTMVEGLLS